MPKPVEALPCGSRSTISTCSPMAARAVPRLIAVVVLPTPPFWLAIASTRGRAGSTRAAVLPKGTTCGCRTLGSETWRSETWGSKTWASKTCGPLAGSGCGRSCGKSVIVAVPSDARRPGGRCSEARNPSSRASFGTSTRLKAADDDDAALRAGLAGHLLGLDNPIFSGFGQFSIYILSLVEQSDGAALNQRKHLIAKGFQRG